MIDDMPRPRYPHAHREFNRHGNPVWYFRRGWGPTTPTERMRRKDDVRAAMHCLSSALGDLTLSEDEAEAVDQEVLERLDAAYQTVHKQYVATIAILNSMDDPIPLPDLEASPHV